MAKRTTKGGTWKGLPKGQKLRLASEKSEGGLTTATPSVETTDDLARVVRDDLGDLLKIAEELLSGGEESPRILSARSLIFDAQRWCDSLASALEDGEWQPLLRDHGEEAENVWADASKVMMDRVETDYHGSLLVLCVRNMNAARESA